MKVTADQVASIRAYLRGDTEEFKRIDARLDPAGNDARGTFIAAAFFKAAERMFRGGTAADVIEFVGRTRARSQDAAESIDPRIAERLLIATFKDENLDDIDGETQGTHVNILLAGMVAEARLSDEELDAFLDDARELADDWMN